MIETKYTNMLSKEDVNYQAEENRIYADFKLDVVEKLNVCPKLFDELTKDIEKTSSWEFMDKAIVKIVNAI